MLKGIVNGVEKEITRIPMLVNGTYKEGWEIRDSSDRLIWGYNSTITGTSPLSFKGGGTALTDYSITGNLSQSSVPSTSTPVYPSETGDLVTSGEHAGEYAIPITCGGTTSTIYLQEPIRKIGDYADVCGLSIGGAKRRIKKRVLTGDENWSIDVRSGTFYTDSCTDYLCTSGVTCMSSHYVGVENATGASAALQGISFITNPDYYRLYIKDPNFNSLEAFVAFLKGQYNASTPVTVWYVLASETTEAADIPTIATTRGSNTLSIGTTLPPSSVSITGHIR